MFVILYWKFAQGQLESQKAAVRARQRAIVQSLGPRIFPFRDRVEEWVRELASAPAAQVAVVSQRAELRALAAGPGVYLRLRAKNAQRVQDLRQAASASLHDGFVSCLFQRRETRTGPHCSALADCAPGLLCTEWQVCAKPTQPFNMRLAYRALRVLTPDWSDELQRASTDLAVRVFELDLEAASKNDVPLAIDLLSSARFFTAVIDEEPRQALPEALVRDRADKQETVEERIQRTPHWVRMGVWDLRSGQVLAEHRALADAQFVPVGDRAIKDVESLAAQQRQVNNCSLALSLRHYVESQRAPVGP